MVKILKHNEYFDFKAIKENKSLMSELEEKIYLYPNLDFEHFLHKELNLSKITSAFINDLYNKNWFYNIGEYLLNSVSVVSNSYKIIDAIGGYFLTTSNHKEIFNIMWGEPIKHQDKYIYFVEIESYLFCFFIDDSGLSIYADSEISTEKVFKCIKIIIDDMCGIDKSYLTSVVNKFSKYL